MIELTDQAAKMCHILKLAAISAYSNSEAHGFWGEGTKTTLGYAAKIARMHSACSGLLEALRKNPKSTSTKVPEITCEEEEAADIFIRLLDYCHARDINLGLAAILKHEYNLSQKV